MVKKQTPVDPAGKTSEEVLTDQEQAQRPDEDKEAVQKTLVENQQAARPDTKKSD